MNHRFQKGTYFTECSRCGMREHWAPSLDCGPRVDRGEVSIAFAQSAMMHDLVELKRWWKSRTDLPSHLPSIEEWRAEFLAWSLKRSSITPTTKDEST